MNAPSGSTPSLSATQARRVRLVGLDVDGVLTDGGIYLGAVGGEPLEFKRYDIQDGLGIHFLREAGIRVAIVTGRVSESVRLRAAELRIEDVAQDALARKVPALLAMLMKWSTFHSFIFQRYPARKRKLSSLPPPRVTPSNVLGVMRLSC